MDQILVAREGVIQRITINRPENAFDTASGDLKIIPVGKEPHGLTV